MQAPFLKQAIYELRSHAACLSALLESAPPEWVLWKPSPEKWCPLEILCHLCDEEVLDFSARLRSVLEDPDRAFQPIHPVAWVTEHQYLQQDFSERLESFRNRRRENLDWLETQAEAAWDHVHQHPKLGPMSARFILANWVAHDILHLKQLLRSRYDHLATSSGQSLAYAGAWI